MSKNGDYFMNNKKSPVLPILTGIMLFLYAGLNGYSAFRTIVSYFNYMDVLNAISATITIVLPILLLIAFGICALNANKHKKILVPVLFYALAVLLVTFIVPLIFDLIKKNPIGYYLAWDNITAFALILLAVIFMFIQNPFGKEDGQQKEKKNKKEEAPEVTPEELQEAEELYAAGVLSDEEIEDMRNKAAS